MRRRPGQEIGFVGAVVDGGGATRRPSAKKNTKKEKSNKKSEKEEEGDDEEEKKDIFLFFFTTENCVPFLSPRRLVAPLRQPSPETHKTNGFLLGSVEIYEVLLIF